MKNSTKENKELINSVKELNKRSREIEKLKDELNKDIVSLIKPIINKCEQSKDSMTLSMLADMLDYSSPRQFIFQAIHKINNEK